MLTPKSDNGRTHMNNYVPMSNDDFDAGTAIEFTYADLDAVSGGWVGPATRGRKKLGSGRPNIL